MAFSGKDLAVLLKTLKFDDSLELDADYYGNLDSWSFKEAMAILSVGGKHSQDEVIQFVESSLRINDILLLSSVLPPLDNDDDETHFHPILFIKWAISKGLFVDYGLLGVLKKQGLPSIHPDELRGKIREIFEGLQEQQVKTNTPNSSTELPASQSANKKAKNKHGFPPKLKDWKQVSFCVLNDEQFEIQAAGKNFSQEEVFGEKPSAYLIGLLYRVTLMDKGFESSSFEGIKPNTARKYIERLNDLLTELFQINQPPITYNRKAGQYEIGFVCEKDLTQDEITPESNTPGGITIPKTKTRFDQNQ